MLLNDLHEVKITKNNLDYYRQFYPHIQLKDMVNVTTFQLPIKSNRKIRYQCDKCGNINITGYDSFNRKNNKNDKCYCIHCKSEKAKQTNLHKYGVENVMHDLNIKAKNRQTVIEKYGVDNVFQLPDVKNKSKQTIQEKYGVDHVMHCPAIKHRVHEQCYKTLCEKGLMIASAQQRYVCELYGAQLNYYVDKCCLDMYFDNGICCEWNGSGHNIDVKYHKLTEKEFQAKEMRRYEFLKSKGYKMFEIISRHDIVPSDNILLQIKQYAFNKLLKEDYNWVRFDIDNEVVEYKNNTEKFNYK